MRVMVESNKSDTNIFLSWEIERMHLLCDGAFSTNHALSLTHANTHTHTLSHSPLHTLSQSHLHIHTNTLSLIQTYTHIHPLSHFNANSLSHSHTYTPHTHTLTHTFEECVSTQRAKMWGAAFELKHLFLFLAHQCLFIPNCQNNKSLDLKVFATPHSREMIL